MNLNKSLAMSVVALFYFSQAQAADFNFSGNLASYNDVEVFDFSLAASAANVRVWTDSFQSGVNFDPIAAVWSQSGSDWSLIGQNDDNPSIAPGQTYYDSGLTFASLAAGAYRFTVGAYPNFAIGSLLSQGFSFDNQTPSAVNRGSYYNAHLSGVDSAAYATPTSAVPEPETYAMLLIGLGLMGLTSRRVKKNASSKRGQAFMALG